MKLYKALFYNPPGAGSVSLACKHDIRYPDVCEECNDAENTYNRNANDSNSIDSAIKKFNEATKNSSIK